MARPRENGRRRLGPGRLLLPAATMAGLALALSFGVTHTMERILSAQGGEAVEPAGMDAPTRAAESPPPEPLSKRAYERAILGRDIFATSKRPGPELWTPPVDTFPVEDAQLIATVVAEQRDDSSALIAIGHGAGHHVGVYSLGDLLLDQGRITRIDQGRVTLHSLNGQVQHLVMGMRVDL
jgi:hypothetical protein